jgi:hypothetical protein
MSQRIGSGPDLESAMLGIRARLFQSIELTETLRKDRKPTADLIHLDV